MEARTGMIWKVRSIGGKDALCYLVNTDTEQVLPVGNYSFANNWTWPVGNCGFADRWTCELMADLFNTTGGPGETRD